MKLNRGFLLVAAVGALVVAAQVTRAAVPSASSQPRTVAQVPAKTVALNLRSLTVPAALKTALAGKALFDQKALESRLTYTAAQIPTLKLAKGRQILLEKVGVEPTAPAATTSATLTAKMAKYRTHLSQVYYGKARLAAVALLPAVVDHASVQTAIRDQGNRGTCVAHAAMAGIESVYKRGGTTKDLSENHAYNLFMVREGSTCVADPGLKTWKAGAYLLLDRVCEETQSPYVNPLAATCSNIPTACNTNKKHGHLGVSTFYSPEFGGTGTNIATNTNYLESLLREDYDIVLGVYVAGSDWHDGSADTGVIDVQLNSAGNPASAYGGHAMLLVGYDRTNNYFKFKNSWGATEGHAGYFHLTYEYLQTYAKYGYVITSATTP